MKTTLEIPDELCRQANVHAAQESRRKKDLVSDGLRLFLGLTPKTRSMHLRHLTTPPVKIRKGNVIPALSNEAMARVLERSGERLP